MKIGRLFRFNVCSLECLPRPVSPLCRLQGLVYQGSFCTIRPIRHTPVFFFLIRYRERSGSYVFHIKELQYHAKPDKPDALFAKKLQEILGGQFGELAIKELEAKENVVVSSTFPRNLEKREVSRVLFNFSRGNESAAGRWAKGRSIDGEGVFHM
ncbi:uncharacterized protein S101395_02630 [Bacillus sonorensis]|uniref:Manganese-containing catalase YdbD n=2 Tax=Bacillus sonorensis TaxID=119858 RepID=M5PEI4_9BACI|nr:uncharacterized protein S101395_02630 [Bacillus sonorensis]EME75635.1 manganese-containing catalase YdbD [Bacillus sonorensis L12]TWK84234.1 putative manganese catalase [Bacillus paralicheniformis]